MICIGRCRTGDVKSRNRVEGIGAGSGVGCTFGSIKDLVSNSVRFN